MDPVSDPARASGDFVLRPVPPRVIGPGRRERAYRARITDLECDLVRSHTQRTALSQRLVVQERELHVAQRIERGCQRRIDRLEERVDRTEQQKARLILTLGGLQKENELLRAELDRRALGGPSAPRLATGDDTGAPAVESSPEPAREPTREAARDPGPAPRRKRAGRTTRPPRSSGLWSRLFGR